MFTYQLEMLMLLNSNTVLEGEKKKGKIPLDDRAENIGCAAKRKFFCPHNVD